MTENNNNDKIDQNNYTDYKNQETTYSTINVSGGVKVDDNKVEAPEEHFPVYCLVKAKRGRPPSKPPTREVVRKRRKVCLYINFNSLIWFSLDHWYQQFFSFFLIWNRHYEF